MFNRFYRLFSHSNGSNSTLPAPEGNHNLVLFSGPSCPYCHRVVRVIDDLGIEVELRDIGTDQDAYETLTKTTGRRTIPCLFIDGVPLFESRDIIGWLQKYASSNGGD